MVAADLIDSTPLLLAAEAEVRKTLRLFVGTLCFAWLSGAGLIFRESPDARMKSLRALLELKKELSESPRTLVVLACVTSFFAIPLFDGIDIEARNAVAAIYLIIAIICAAISLWMFWESVQVKRWIDRYPALKLTVPPAGFIIYIWARSLADGKIQYAVGVGPEELATAGHALGVFYAVIIATIFGSILFTLAGLTAIIHLFRSLWSDSSGQVNAIKGAEIEIPTMILGLLFSAMTLSSMPVSSWANSRIEELSSWLLVATSFSPASPQFADCLINSKTNHEIGALIRVVGGGEKIIVASKTGFKPIECSGLKTSNSTTARPL